MTESYNCLLAYNPFHVGDVIILTEYGDHIFGGGVAVKVLRPTNPGQAPTLLRSSDNSDDTRLVADATTSSVIDLLTALVGLELESHPEWRPDDKEVLVVRNIHEPFITARQ